MNFSSKHNNLVGEESQPGIRTPRTETWICHLLSHDIKPLDFRSFDLTMKLAI